MGKTKKKAMSHSLFVLNFMLRDCHVAFFLCTDTHTHPHTENSSIVCDFNFFLSVSMLCTIFQFQYKCQMLMIALLFFLENTTLKFIKEKKSIKLPLFYRVWRSPKPSNSMYRPDFWSGVQQNPTNKMTQKCFFQIHFV